jgi:murein DD-endopeptidase MepM/ murein hydrolase activator NlpD
MLRSARKGLVLAACTAAAVLLLPAAAAATPGQPNVAALQVGLQEKGLYAGPIDGVMGPATAQAVRAFQRRAGLASDGVPGPATRAAFGAYGRYELGDRPLAAGTYGWDVAELQFLVAWHGFPSSTFSGGFGSHLQRALVLFQRWAGLPADGVAGPATFAALQRPPAQCPLRLARPVTGPLGSPFGPRGFRFHAGIDLVAAAGTPVAAAASGIVTYAGYLDGGWGNLVVITHSSGVQTFYAHLSQIGTSVGQRVTAGTPIGRVGATGDATGPHLHFEVRVRGAAVDPLPALA